jgi:hypothetical protein
MDVLFRDRSVSRSQNPKLLPNITRKLIGKSAYEIWQDGSALFRRNSSGSQGEAPHTTAKEEDQTTATNDAGNIG